MNVVTGAEDVSLHLRVPAVGLVAKVSASFQKLTHAEIGQRHDSSPVFASAGLVNRVAPATGRVPKDPSPHV